MYSLAYLLVRRAVGEIIQGAVMHRRVQEIATKNAKEIFVSELFVCFLSIRSTYSSESAINRTSMRIGNTYRATVSPTKSNR